MQRWYVVATNPARETMAAIQLQNQGFKAYLPTRSKSVRHARKSVIVAAPLFPGYLFVELDPDRVRWRSINGTIGVRSLLSADSRPLPLPVGFVEGLLRLSDTEGRVCFGPKLVAGEKAILLSGPFSDRIGIILSTAANGRVKLLLELLSSSVPVETRAENLMPV